MLNTLKYTTAILWKSRKILWSTTKNDISGRFKGTVFGSLWTIIYPLLFLSLYAVVYTMIYQIRVPNFTDIDYVLLIFCGLIPFLGFSEALGNGVGSIVGNKGLIKNTIFPIELIPVKAVFTSSVTMIVGLLILLIVLWTKGISHSTQLLIPLIFILQIMFTIGFIWLLSAVNVFIPDLNQMISILILFLMLVSPIAYTHDMIPKALMPFMYPNPLYYLIMLYRDAAFMGVINIELLTIFCLISVLTFFLGGFVFVRLKPIFADYV